MPYATIPGFKAKISYEARAGYAEAAPSTRWAPDFNAAASTYMEIDEAQLFTIDDSFSFRVLNCTEGDEYFGGMSAASNTNGVFCDYTNGAVRVFVYGETSLIVTPISVLITEGSDLEVSLAVSGDIGTLTVNGISSTGEGWSSLDGAQGVKFLGRRAASYNSSILFDVGINSAFYALDNPFSAYPNFDGVTAHNFVASDIVEISV